jgi:hypothetical protein
MNFVHNILLLHRGSMVMDDMFRGKWLTQAGEKSRPIKMCASPLSGEQVPPSAAETNRQFFVDLVLSAYFF